MSCGSCVERNFQSLPVARRRSPARPRSGHCDMQAAAHAVSFAAAPVSAQLATRPQASVPAAGLAWRAQASQVRGIRTAALIMNAVHSVLLRARSALSLSCQVRSPGVHVYAPVDVCRRTHTLRSLVTQAFKRVALSNRSARAAAAGVAIGAPSRSLCSAANTMYEFEAQASQNPGSPIWHARPRSLKVLERRPGDNLTDLFPSSCCHPAGYRREDGVPLCCLSAAPVQSGKRTDVSALGSLWPTGRPAGLPQVF